MTELPVKPNLEWLKKAAKRLKKEKGCRLYEAQHMMARSYGFVKWTELIKEVGRRNETRV